MKLNGKLHRIAAALALAATCLAPQAHALGRLADVSVVDRHTGATLATHYYRGEYWVAGAPGAKYAITVRNRLGERLLAVAAVDGVNVLTGDTAGWEQAGYVFAPGQSYQVTGWRKSNAEVAAFEFTASPNSYAERTGRPAHVGVIGVALFRERQPEPPVMRWPEPAARLHIPAPAPAAPSLGDASREAPRDSANESSGSGVGGNTGGSTGGSAGALAAQKAPSAESAFGAERRAAAPAAAAPAPRLGTGHGQREASYVTQTEFARLQPQPNEVIRIRYDSRENLIALGVIRGLGPQPAVPNPFPESPTARFVPDPPAYR